MSTLSDEYIKNFSKERKAIFNKRFSDDYDPNMSERSNIIRILNEMRELGLAEGGITRIGLKNGMKLSDFFKIQASGSKSGKQQIEGAPEGFTIDKETFNAIIKADIPISEKIDLLASYEYGKGRDRIEKDDQELFLGEGGFKDRNIGLGFNKDGKGIGGTLMYNLDTGEPEFRIGFKKEFNKGGRVGFRIGSDEGKDVSGREYGTTSAASMGVATSPSRDDSDDTFTNGRNNNNPVVDIGKAIATNTAKTYAKNKAIEKLGLGGIMSMSPQVMAILGILKTLRDPQIEDEDIKFAKGGRVAYQDGTPDRKLYETPVTDAIKSVNEKTIDAIQKGKEGFERFTGIDQIEPNFPGSFDDPEGQPSDFRHQAASNLVAQALGKGAYSDPILGPISYLSGGIGSFGLGTVKEIGDLVAGLLDKNTTAKEAFSQAYEDTISNFKGAFAPAGTTSQELYDKLMEGYVPIDPFGMDRTSLLRSQQIFAQRKKALEDARKKQKDFIEQEATKTPPKKPKRTTTTKPGTGGGGGGRQVDTSRGAVRGAQQDISNYQDFGEVPLAKGGIARMLGE